MTDIACNVFDGCWILLIKRARWYRAMIMTTPSFATGMTVKVDLIMDQVNRAIFPPPLFTRYDSKSSPQAKLTVDPVTGISLFSSFQSAGYRNNLGC